MSADRDIKKIFLRKLGRRTAGRPELRWSHYTENNLKSMSIYRWMKKAEDRPVLAVILKEALVELQGL